FFRWSAFDPNLSPDAGNDTNRSCSTQANEPRRVAGIELISSCDYLVGPKCLGRPTAIAESPEAVANTPQRRRFSHQLEMGLLSVPDAELHTPLQTLLSLRSRKSSNHSRPSTIRPSSSQAAAKT